MVRACSMGSLFGEGVYFAECIEKADQYAGDADREHNECGIDRHSNPYNLEGLHSLLYPQPEDHPGNVSYALVCRVALGYSIRTQVGVRAYYCATTCRVACTRSCHQLTRCCRAGSEAKMGDFRGNALPWTVG
eukprot:SAG25_NODE_734_length_5654_cov_2.735734_3_plen_133_part_00